MTYWLRTRAWIHAAAACALLLLGAGARASTFTVEPLPHLPIDRPNAAVTVSRNMVQSLLGAHVPAALDFKLMDDQYFLVKREWVEAVHRWFIGFVRDQLGPERAQDFLRSRPRKTALMLESLAELQVQQQHALKSQALIGMLSVECHRIESQVPIDGHLCFFVIFGTLEGFYVMDPVTGRSELLRDFPLRNDVVRVYF